MLLLTRPKISVRLAQPADRSKIAELEILAIKDLCQGNDNPPQIDFLRQKQLPRKFWDEVVFVAEIEDKIVGFACLLSYRKIVSSMYVDPNFSRQGIDNQLLEALEKEAIKRNIDSLQVTSSVRGEPFYTARGYETTAQCNLWHMDLLVPCVAMKKNLVFAKKQLAFCELLSQITLVSMINLFFLIIAL